MPDRLTPLDASFLHTETASAHMHVAWKGRFRPDRARAPVTLARVQAQVASRLGAAPRFRQRLAFPPGGFAHPVWVDAEHFDVRRHVVALAGDDEPLSRGRFGALSDAALSRPLDRTHPLWEIHLAPRLEDGTVGLLMKIHHALVDGKSALAVALLLLDVDPDAPEPPAPRDMGSAGRGPGAARLAVDALVDSGAEPLRALGRAARAAGSPARLSGTLRRAAMAVGEDVARPAPSSFLNDPIGPRRTLVGNSMPIAGLLEVKHARDASLNDVALAVVAGALRQLALLRRVAPEPLKVMVPVSRRAAGEEAAMGNRIAFVFITLPVNVRDPLARLDAIRAETAAFKGSGRAGGGEALLQGLGLLPLPLQVPLARFAASPRMYNLVISNVPGPRMPVYLLGAECIEVLPAIPLSEGHALSVGIFSLRDRLCFGAYADPEALPQAGRLPGAIRIAALELSRASGARAPLRLVA
ncbi:MAG: diacylglycerol O-acyltransferase / wax synthase [Solirubrobacteraceae bacterium]|nr:diacylglycerol O-acyltransferase / wax synthase [Solirubrobacteraceae bacterium]